MHWDKKERVGRQMKKSNPWLSSEHSHPVFGNMEFHRKKKIEKCSVGCAIKGEMF